MDPLHHEGNVPVEDRIDQLAKLVLVILLLATLGWIGKGRTHDAIPGALRAPRQLNLVQWTKIPHGKGAGSKSFQSR